jgi:histidinol-phosphate aminotransferase
MAFASKEIIQIYFKIKPPYNLSEPVQELALKALDNVDMVNAMIKELVTQREWLENELANVPAVIHIYPSDANFLLVKVKDATSMYQHLINNKIVVRDRSKVVLCENALRITVGTEKENQLLIQAMKAWQV